MLTHEGKERSFAATTILAVILSSVAGMVNASGFFAVGAYTSHVTGHVSMAGDEFAQGRRGAATAALALVALFIIGAITASLFVEGAKRLGRAPYAGALITEAAILVVIAGASAWIPLPAGGFQLVLTALLCFAMGMQNALVTRISDAVIRTTHLTGVATDIGIEIAAVVFWFRDRAKGKGAMGWITALFEAPRVREARRLLLHLAIFGSFLAGAVIGPMLYLRRGHLAMLLPAGLILLLVAFDVLGNAWIRPSSILPAPSEEEAGMMRPLEPSVSALARPAGEEGGTMRPLESSASILARSAEEEGEP